MFLEWVSLSLPLLHDVHTVGLRGPISLGMNYLPPCKSRLSVSASLLWMLKCGVRKECSWEFSSDHPLGWFASVIGELVHCWWLMDLPYSFIGHHKEGHNIDSFVFFIFVFCWFVGGVPGSGCLPVTFLCNLMLYFDVIGKCQNQHALEGLYWGAFLWYPLAVCGLNRQLCSNCWCVRGVFLPVGAWFIEKLCHE